MSRRLSAEEQELWARVAETVHPLHPARRQAAEAAPESKPAPAPPPRRDAGPKRAPPAPAIGPNPRTPAAHAESLDGGWDRRLASGRLHPDLVIDLHGLSREQARHILYRRVLDAEARGLRTLLVITGKGQMPGPSPADLMEGRPTRGAIRADLPRWLGEAELSSRIAAVRRAHPRHGGAGAAYIILKRRRS
ncbi:Smr/MutS family protein [Sandaracinobacter sp. RS1-74]|uniref:Smr/MutS family protein n=1 Tax=Sandaracinobacteroides sayramensis TaxID=2913411 RepID=UPI001EDB2802|nr:Smr/MutS family protein [Sandaracinobacteroides sayramensis]MCG2841169.1 Smr/MutS family protein [Sandaracinobacteroides sayramensis]